MSELKDFLIQKTVGLGKARGLGDIEAFRPSGASVMGPVWPVGTPSQTPSRAPTRVRPGAKGGIYPYYRPGLGAAGASEFTVKAAELLDEHLTTNACAGCDVMSSSLRQLTFAFKAACLTDPAIAPNVNLNVTTPLAMTGFGPGSNQALTLVLGNLRTYEGQNCTDDNGNCVAGTFVTPTIPGSLSLIAQQIGQQIFTLITQHQGQPQATQLDQQASLVAQLTAIVNQLLQQISNLLQPSPGPGPKYNVPSPTVKESVTTTTTTEAAAPMPTWQKVGIVVAAGSATAALVYVAYRATR